MHLPSDIQPLIQDARRYKTRDIEFSGSTYQVQVIDPADSKIEWAFLQVDDLGSVRDCFCSCEVGEGGSPCVHIAAAWLRIFQGHARPLHQRFEDSLWNHICRLFSDRLGDDPQLFQRQGKDKYGCSTVSGKLVFLVKALTPSAMSKLKEIVEERQQETEETSLKFSNLSQDELALWREGRPSSQLRYELSFWNDLAKWLLFLQESETTYRISFDYDEKNIPLYLNAFFEDLELSFYLSKANLPLIIPALATVKSFLKVHNTPQEAIERIDYDKQHGNLLIIPRTGHEKTRIKHHEKGIHIEGWIYVKGDGFYAREKHKLLATPAITGKKVSQALNEHFSVIQQLMKAYPLHLEPVRVSYTISFDSEWNLHLIAYVFIPGDLTNQYSRFFGEWAFLDDEGFYRLQGMQFSEPETTIPHARIGDFVTEHRTWLNNQEGFRTHLASVEARLNYTLSKDNQLEFSRAVYMKGEMGETADFGSWIYVAGQGFYSKVHAPLGLPLSSEMIVSGGQIPVFIRANYDELQLVPHFFSAVCPIARCRLHVSLNAKERICIEPHYEFLPAYRDKPVRIFDDFAYVEGEGFHEVPTGSRLPERYRHDVQIEPGDVEFFLTYELESLKDFVESIDPRLVKPDRLALTATSIEKEDRGYSLKLKYVSEQGNIPVTSLWSSLNQHQLFIFSPAGLIDLSEDRFHWLRWLRKTQIDKRSHTVHLSTLEVIRLQAMEGIHTKGQESTDALLKELTDLRLPEDPDLTGLCSNLRSYQMIGVRWLWFLYHHAISGLLCDDMGLGKTHQTMALIAAIRNRCAPRKTHFLVVCPTSVLYHWQEKLQQFLPDLKVCTFYGSNRSLKDFQEEYDLLLTSYGVWRIEHELLSEMPFELAIFDEIQIAKNHVSRLYSTLLDVNAKMRLGLTGTPIENCLRELKTLFDLVLPSYMPPEVEFREWFVKPIEKENDSKRRDLLNRLIKPFVMRRKKEDVLLDLPEKIEEISHCDLMPEQERLYRDSLNQSRAAIMQEMSGSNSPIPYIHIFALLSRLKQICNHPAVFLKQPSKYKEHESGKWELFVELLREARESRQKVVVFSQYLMMLDIMENYLNEMGVGFAAIRGSTVNRGEQIKRFAEDPSCEVFLASLQASGLGIDLTAASVVIHYDRWWNAARENQATDRVHRIGQQRGVQVFKLVTKNTFEERIDMLISKKGKLMEDVVGVDDHQLIKHFTREELLELLSITG